MSGAIFNLFSIGHVHNFTCRITFIYSANNSMEQDFSNVDAIMIIHIGSTNLSSDMNNRRADLTYHTVL